jgi:hypothetical protein
MKMVYLLHGFNVGDRGKKTTDKFGEVLQKRGFLRINSKRDILNSEGLFYQDLDYGWTGLAGVRVCDRKLGGWLAEMAIPGSIVIAHSNGCAIASYASEAGAPFSGMVMIQPALNKDWVPPNQVKWMDVYYNRKDFWTWVSAILPGHRWGAMGYYGPKYTDSRVRSFNTWLEYHTGGHSTLFKDLHFEYWGQRVVDRALSYSEKHDTYWDRRQKPLNDNYVYYMDGKRVSRFKPDIDKRKEFTLE